MTTTYQIQMRLNGAWNGDSENFGRDDDCNVFQNEADANDAMAKVSQMWPDAELRVVELAD